MSKEYRDTLNLPQTDLSMKAGLPKKEPEMLNFWSNKNLKQKVVKQVPQDEDELSDIDLEMDFVLDKWRN